MTEITPTQADREAAVELAKWFLSNISGELSPEMRTDFILGYSDHLPLVQILTRHRIAALEDAAKVLDEYARLCSIAEGYEGDAIFGDIKEISIEIAAAIRALKEQQG